MSRHDFDKTSKWLVQHHGEAILYLAGARGVHSCRALQAEVVQPRRLPDGLLEVAWHRRKAPSYVVVEVATYAERRVEQQAFEDLMLVYQDRRELPDMLAVILRPKGQLAVAEKKEVESSWGWSALSGKWKVVELWKLSARALLAAKSVGLVPWVPLAHYDGPAEELLQRCRERIERGGTLEEQTNLLAVTQVLARLRFPSPEHLALLGGRRVMIESPLIRELMAEQGQDYIIDFLAARFGAVPPDLVAHLRKVVKERHLKDLVKQAALCPDLETFRSHLLSK